jgi:hypothetical protein
MSAAGDFALLAGWATMGEGILNMSRRGVIIGIGLNRFATVLTLFHHEWPDTAKSDCRGRKIARWQLGLG